MTRRERDRKRYATDPASRARQRERQNRWWRNKYATDSEFRAQMQAEGQERIWLRRGIRLPSI